MNMFQPVALGGRTKNNPCAGVRNLSVPEQRPRFLSEEEIGPFLGNSVSEWGVSFNKYPTQRKNVLDLEAGVGTTLRE